MSPSITVVIHTHNEEKNIDECIQSAKLLTKDIVVIDMESKDHTRDIVKKKNIRIINFPFSTYVEPARKFGISQTKSDWIFILDADERMTAELAAEILKTITDFSLTYTFYKVPRKNIFGRKKWLKHGGWWPDHQIRLIQKKSFQNWPEKIHSTPEITGTMGFLKNAFLHYFHGDIESMVSKTMIYENIEAELLYKAGRTVKTITFYRKFFGELFRRLIRSRGYLDGTVGIIESIYQAYSKTITYLYLYEKKKSSTL
ncbi:glycosyltransferase family 2 protein [Candidatus Woesebacteria bacterium]|nr:glycosyltransferase family 2 protein [Candidatus Woesebacteria bacterium]